MRIDKNLFEKYFPGKTLKDLTIREQGFIEGIQVGYQEGIQIGKAQFIELLKKELPILSKNSKNKEEFEEKVIQFLNEQ